ncbi:hypothetical protein ACFPTX_05040 [Pseudomonas sp. GCM10022188]|uniref:hypothetical protein n=1 Tax=Pseudomonas TaxID=286 RepID=UPI001E419FA2|nr:hypothetical protein [Pseudomonas oryzagri]MCC6077046.1 hypothetical protein [Pseudomonas oryzagri]
MDNPLDVMTALAAFGILLRGVGCHRRGRAAGVAVPAGGVRLMLSSPFYRLYPAFA